MTEPERVIHCPACGLRYVVEASAIADDVRLLCGTCGTVSAAAAFSSTASPSGPVLSLGPRVVVGHAVPSASRGIAGTLRAGGFAPVCVRSGAEVLQACDTALPAPAEAVVLDVGIDDVLAFEVIEQLRAVPSTSKVPVVLLASVFEHTRYKRRPNRLYGADGYLELHHVPDRLVSMLVALRGDDEVEETWMQSPSDRAHAAPLRGAPPTGDEQDSRAIARRVLSDVALYHGTEVARGVARGDPFVELQEAIADGRVLVVKEGDKRAGEIFDEELARFGDRLMFRDRAEHDG